MNKIGPNLSHQEKKKCKSYHIHVSIFNVLTLNATEINVSYGQNELYALCKYIYILTKDMSYAYKFLTIVRAPIYMHLIKDTNVGFLGQISKLFAFDTKHIVCYVFVC